MFDLGFTELFLIAVVALIVIGPERLPKTARVLGKLCNRAQRQVNKVRIDIQQEMRMEDSQGLEDIKSIHRDVSGVAHDAKSVLQSVVRGFTEEVKKTGDEVTPSGDNPLPEKKTTPTPSAWPGAASAPDSAKTQAHSPRRGDSRLLDLLRNLPKEDEAEVCKLLRDLARKSESGESPRLAG